MDYEKAWNRLKEVLVDYEKKLESKLQSVHSNWTGQYYDRLYEIGSVLKTMESFEKKGVPEKSTASEPDLLLPSI